MEGFNIVLVYSPDMARVLMCVRRKPPFKGLLNLVGGHIEPGEDGLSAAHRELWEETGIGRDDITLSLVMEARYPLKGEVLELYAGRLARDVPVDGDENPLVWVDAGEDFFDGSRFAGHGLIGHLIREAGLFAETLFS